MTQENKLTNEEIAKVFAMYLGCRYQVTINIEKNKVTDEVSGIVIDEILDENWTNSESNYRDKLLLTSLSNITDEDAILFYHQYCGTIAKYDYTQDFKYLHEEAKHWIQNGGLEEIDKYTCLSDIARSRGYATKLYFKANHWANSKTAIELKIAVEK